MIQIYTYVQVCCCKGKQQMYKGKRRSHHQVMRWWWKEEEDEENGCVGQQRSCSALGDAHMAYPCHHQATCQCCNNRTECDNFTVQIPHHHHHQLAFCCVSWSHTTPQQPRTLCSLDISRILQHPMKIKICFFWDNPQRTNLPLQIILENRQNVEEEKGHWGCLWRISKYCSLPTLNKHVIWNSKIALHIIPPPQTIVGWPQGSAVSKRTRGQKIQGHWRAKTKSKLFHPLSVSCLPPKFNKDELHFQQKVRKKPKETVWTRQNKGLEERSRRDQVAVAQDVKSIEQSEAKLKEKAKIYESFGIVLSHTAHICP